ncbi:MAG: DUF5658 family protein [Chloroflexi bacterium]|nr:DUF5658 family protein [Chloroflexota bacterium]
MHAVWKRLDLTRTQFTLVILFAATQLLDIITTRLGLQRGATEGNFIPSLILASHGQAGMYLSKLVIVCLILAVVVLLSTRYKHLWQAIRIINVITCLVVISNMVAIFAVRA